MVHINKKNKRFSKSSNLTEDEFKMIYKHKNSLDMYLT